VTDAADSVQNVADSVQNVAEGVKVYGNSTKKAVVAFFGQQCFAIMEGEAFSGGR
jgi:hypothetical protein